MLNSDAQSDHFFGNASLAPLLDRHLPMSGGSRVTSQRFRVTQIHHSRNESQLIVKAGGCAEAATNPKCHKRTGASAEVFLREPIVRIFFKTGIVDPFDA